MENTIILFLLGLIVVIILLQGLKKIKASPPYKGQRTFLGKKVPDKVYNEGWVFCLFYPILFGFIPIKMKKIPFSIISKKVKTPDLADSRVPVEITITPDPNHLIEYINNGEEEGVKTQLTGIILEKIREWCMGQEEGPATWKELNMSTLEGASVLIRKITGKDSLSRILDEAQSIPTWILLRYFSEPRPTKWLKNEKPWTKKKWEKVNRILDKLDENKIKKLKTSVLKRRSEIEGIRKGSGKIALNNFGVILNLLNIGEVELLGEAGKKAELEVKEELERQGETLELEHVANRIKALMKKRPEGPGLTLEQAIEQVQLTLKQASKIVDAKTITFDATTATMIAKILGGINGKN